MTIDLFAICVAVAISLTCVIACVTGCIFAFLAYSKVVGLEKSTHKIQWMPVDAGLTGNELAKKLYDSEIDFEDDEHV